MAAASELIGLQCRLDDGKWLNDFTNKLTIGGGSYGRVYKALYNVDKQKYAVKIVPINRDVDPGRELEAIFREKQQEVIKLAKLTGHLNIITYKTAWYENATHAVDHEIYSDEASPLSKSAGISATKQHRANEDEFNLLEDSTTEIITTETIQPLFDCNLFIQMELGITSLSTWLKQRNGLIKDENHEINLRYDASKDGITDSGIGDSNDETNSNDVSHKSLKGWVRPRVEMTKSDDQDLCEWVKKSSTNSCLEGILRGLNYIHSHGYAHGDIAARNVLILVKETGDVIPKLTDFGLVQSLKITVGKPTKGPTSKDTGHHSDDPATSSQAQPSTLRSRYDSLKTDPYSYEKESQSDIENLACVIMKMYCPNFTQPESESALSKKKWNFQSVPQFATFPKHFPVQAEWCTRMKSRPSDPNKTPITTIEMLRQGFDNGIFTDKDTENELLKDENKQSSDLVKKQKIELGAKDEEIKQLKQLLQDKMQVSSEAD